LVDLVNLFYEVGIPSEMMRCIYKFGFCSHPPFTQSLAIVMTDTM